MVLYYINGRELRNFITKLSCLNTIAKDKSCRWSLTLLPPWHTAKCILPSLKMSVCFTFSRHLYAYNYNIYIIISLSIGKETEQVNLIVLIAFISQ